MNGAIRPTALAPLRFLDTPPHLTLILDTGIFILGIAPSIHTITYGGGRALSSPFLLLLSVFDCVLANHRRLTLTFLSLLYYKKKHQPEHSIITKVWVYTGNWDRISENSFFFVVVLICLGWRNIGRLLKGFRAISACCTTTQTGIFLFHTQTVDG